MSVGCDVGLSVGRLCAYLTVGGELGRELGVRAAGASETVRAPGGGREVCDASG